ncbi:hypothetical protein MP228_003067 [Amoeboaphelidium protococcarum]|nr:hypothetical protein MP228_003067 [Amoeboaphelidium protococcarum]
MSKTDSGLINLPKLWQKLPGVDTVWSKDRRAIKMYERWKKSDQGLQAQKLGLIANTSDVAVCLVMPILRKLSTNQPIVQFEERALLSLQQAQSGSQGKETHHQLPRINSVRLQDAVELPSDTYASDTDVANCYTEPCNPASNSSLAEPSISLASQSYFGTQGYILQLASSNASMGYILKSKKLTANILDYMADASEMNDAILEGEFDIEQSAASNAAA